jgi:hypothetical protein
MADPSDYVSTAIRATDIEALYELVRTHNLDFGCRARARQNDQGQYETVAFLTHEELDVLRKEDLPLEIEVISDGLAEDRWAERTVGQGDRFANGSIPPQGLGTNPEQDLGGIMNPDEINSAIEGLVNEYGIPTFDTPNQTAGGEGGRGGSVGGVNVEDYHVYFIAGVHARERGGPDNLIYFIADLLYAWKHGVGIQYGNVSYSNAQALRALSTGIVFFPLVNPDGVRWDQRTNSKWRKNRNPVSATPGDDASIGVDINRNYDFLWDYRTHFHPSVYATSDSLASDDPASGQFHGAAPFSEPESRNVAWVFDQFPRLRWFMDIHSAFGKVLYSWGDDVDQGSDPDQNFRNPDYDGLRGIIPAQDYREWIEEAEQSLVFRVARRTSSSMAAVGGRSYGPMAASDLYATSGASDDYVFSRSQANPGVDKSYGFTMEFGYPYNFYPTVAEFRQNVVDVGSGLMEFCLAAADIGWA